MSSPAQKPRPVPVKKGDQPWPGMEGKVFYVWFDAPIEYIAATAEWADANGKSDADWERWWRTDKGAEDVRYVQFMGKDNVAFHTVSFPVTILGSKEPWKLVDKLKAFNWLNWYGGKFSTSERRGVFMDQALALLPAVQEREVTFLRPVEAVALGATVGFFGGDQDTAAKRV